VDFRESLYRLVGALTGVGVTIFMTAEVIEAFPDGRFTSERVSFVTDDILVQRYVEIDGHLRTVLAVVKMRGSGHATDFRAYDLTATGAVMGESLVGYRGISTGVPRQVADRNTKHPGLTVGEVKLLRSLIRLQSATLDELAKKTGGSMEVVRAGVARLSALGYAGKKNGANGETYRALAPANGA